MPLTLQRADLQRSANFIAGQWLPTSATLAVTDPATGDVITHVPDSGAAEALAALDAAHTAFPAWRDDLEAVEVLPSVDGRQAWRERSDNGDIAYMVTVLEPPTRMVSRITSPDLPFGGYKASGIGREWGVEGIEEYLETKSVATPA